MKNTVKAIFIAGCLSLLSACDSLTLLAMNQVEQTQLTVEGKTLTMNGIINSKTPAQFKQIFQDHPHINTLIMGNVEGSIDDESNLQVAEWISKRPLTFILQSDSEIASGGVDFFLAGQKRIIYKGAKVGVHSWGGDLGEPRAVAYPKGHEVHLQYINYYKSVGFSQQQAEDFYYYTINAAPAESIHWMTDKELEDFHITTEKIRTP